MVEKHIAQIDIKQILKQKAPSVSGKIPGFIVNYLIRTIHQDELNDILRRYHDKQGADFMQELISYFDLTLELVNDVDFSPEVVIFSHLIIRWADWMEFVFRQSSAKSSMGK